MYIVIGKQMKVNKENGTISAVYKLENIEKQELLTVDETELKNYFIVDHLAI